MYVGVQSKAVRCTKEDVQCCGGLSENGPHRLIGNSTIRRFGLVGVVGFVGGSVSLGTGFEVSEIKPGPVSLSPFQLPSDLDVELSAISSAPCLPICSHASHHDDKGLNL